MPDADTYLTLTPFGTVNAVFPPDGGCQLNGPDSAVQHVKAVVLAAADHQGMRMTLDSIEPHDYFHFCQPKGSGVMILEPFDAMALRLRQQGVADPAAVLDAVGKSLAELRAELPAAPTMRKLEIVRAIWTMRQAPAATLDPAEVQRLADKRTLLKDFLAERPDSPNADAWRAQVAEIDAKIGAEPAPAVEQRQPVDMSGWSEAAKRAKALLDEFEAMSFEARINGPVMGVFKRKVRTGAKTIPSDDDKAVFFIDKLALSVWGDGYDPKVAALEFAQPAQAAVNPGATETTTPTPLAADPQRAADEALLAQVIAGTHPDILEPDLVEQIEAVFNRYPDDAAMQAKVDEAIVAYERAALKAAEGI